MYGDRISSIYSRKVADHRVPYDFNYAINKPAFSHGWRDAYKQKWIGIMIKSYALYGSFAVAGFVLVGIYFDSLWRESNPLSHQSSAFKSENNPTVHFLRHHKNKVDNLGNWNHNFSCYENDPDCGKDFDLPCEKKIN